MKSRLVLSFLFASGLMFGLLTAQGADFSSWSHTMRITFDGYAGSTDLTNFPVLVTLSNNIDVSGFDYDAFEDPDGWDLRFLDNDGSTELNYEIEQWDTQGVSHVWVQVPVLENGGTDYIDMFWGNSGAGQQTYTTNGAVWSEDYIMVQHFASTNNDATYDSVNAYDGTLIDSPQLVDGRVGKGLEFDGVADYVDLPDGLADLASFTVEVWAYPEMATTESEWAGFFSFGQSGDPPDDTLTLRRALETTELRAYVSSGSDWSGDSPVSGGNVVSNDSWQYFSVARDDASGNGSLHENGNLLTSESWAAAPNVTRDHSFIARTAWPAGDNGMFDGMLDEFRLSGIARSTNWIRAGYLSMASNTVFSDYGTAELQSSDIPVIANNYATNIAVTSVDMVGNLEQGAMPVAVTCYWGTVEGSDDPGTWANSNEVGVTTTGPVTNSVSGLQAGTRYYFRYYATNSEGEDWAESAVRFSTLGKPTVTNSAATGEGETSATLHGELLGGHPSPEVWIYWGTSEGNTNDKSSWNQTPIDLGETGLETFTTNVTGLLANQAYYYRCYASNTQGEAWSEQATSFTTDVADLSIDDVMGRERDGGTSNFTFTVSLSSATGPEVSMNYATDDGTAVAGDDYTSTSGSLTISSGNTSTGIVVKVLDEGDDAESAENFYVNLSGVTGANDQDTQGVGSIVLHEVTLDSDTNLTGGISLGRISPSGSGTSADPWRYAFTHDLGGLALNEYELFTTEDTSASESFTLDMGGEDVIGDAGITNAISTYPGYDYDGVDAGDISIVNVGTIDCGGINARPSYRNTYGGTGYTRGGDIQMGEADNPAGTIRVDYIYSGEKFNGNNDTVLGFGGNVTIYSSGDVTIVDETGVGEVPGNIDTAAQGDSGGDLAVYHDGAFLADMLFTTAGSSKTSWGSGGDVTFNGDASGDGVGAADTFEVTEIQANNTETDHNPAAGNVTISNYYSVAVHSNLLTSTEGEASQNKVYSAGNITITGIETDITIGSIDASSGNPDSDSDTLEGTLTLACGGSVYVDELDLRLVRWAKFDSASGTSYINGVLTNFTGGDDLRLRTPSGQTVFYQADLNPALAEQTYRLANLDGTEDAGGELKPEAAAGSVFKVR